MTAGLRDLRVAAEKGDANAQCNLGVVYDNLLSDAGRYGEKGNRAEAIKWLLQAAQQGLPRAQARLAEMYADGPDSSGAHVRACTWFLVAAMNLTGAQRQRVQTGYDRVARQLAPARIATARRLARMWKPKPNPVPPAAIVPAASP